MLKNDTPIKFWIFWPLSPPKIRVLPGMDTIKQLLVENNDTKTASVHGDFGC